MIGVDNNNNNSSNRLSRSKASSKVIYNSFILEDSTISSIISYLDNDSLDGADEAIIIRPNELKPSELKPNKLKPNKLKPNKLKIGLKDPYAKFIRRSLA